MSKLTRLTAVPVSIKLGDELYRLSPLSLKSWAVLETWAEEEAFRKARRLLEAAGKGAPEVITKTIWDKALAEAGGGYSACTDTFASVAMFAFLSLKFEHPELTLDTVQDLLSTVNMEELREKLNTVNGIEDVPKNLKTPATEKEPEKKTGESSSAT